MGCVVLLIEERAERTRTMEGMRYEGNCIANGNGNQERKKVAEKDEDEVFTPMGPLIWHFMIGSRDHDDPVCVKYLPYSAYLVRLRGVVLLPAGI